MFTDAEGPTALRTDMIQSLAFSVGEAESEVDGAAEACLAALAGVWNGKQGHVIVLLRSVGSQRVRRFAFNEAIRSANELNEVVEMAMDFATQLGFIMDAHSFRDLSSRDRGERFRRWNELRKAKSAPKGKPAPADELRLVDAVERPATAQKAAEAVDTNEESNAGVLGKIALVRQEEDEGPVRLGRVLGFF